MKLALLKGQQASGHHADNFHNYTELVHTSTMRYAATCVDSPREQDAKSLRKTEEQFLIQSLLVPGIV